MPMLIFDPDGNLIDFWGNKTPNEGQSAQIDSYGNVTARYKVPPRVLPWCIGGALSARRGHQGGDFVRPHAISIDHEDNLWLTDDLANVITKCDKFGNRLMMICPDGKVRVGLGRTLSLCTTAHPLHIIFTNIFGKSISEATMRPNP